jgi:hypothetical protein
MPTPEKLCVIAMGIFERNLMAVVSPRLGVFNNQYLIINIQYSICIEVSPMLSII